MKFKDKTEGFARFLNKISYSKIRLLLLTVSGLFTGLTIVFPEVGFIEWITLIPTGVVLLIRGTDKNVKLRSLYLDGLLFFYMYYVVCYHWFVNLYPLDFVEGMTKGGALAVVLAAVLGLSLLQALMGGLVFLCAALVFRSRVAEKLRLGFVAPFAAAGLWAVFEWLQCFGWWGVPWGRLPIGQTKYLVGLQNASVLGSYFVTFMLVAVNLVLAYALINPPKLRISIITVACLLVFQYGSGTLLWFTNDLEEGQKISVACIQGNISSNEKWDSSSFTKTLKNYSSYTRQAAKQGAQLVIWPETAFPYDISGGEFEIYAQAFASLAKECGVYMLVGTFTSNEQGEVFNSLVCFTPDGRELDTVYSKRRLVPFGEFVPIRPVIETLIPPLAELVMSGEEIASGEGAQIIQLDNGIAIGGLVCFDSIYDELTLESVRSGATLMCLSTNDSWFTDSRALNIHNAQAQLRAIESGRYVARAANTGITTAINSRGEVIDSIEPLVDGMLAFDAYARDGRTPWSVAGNMFVYVLFALYILVFAWEGLVKAFIQYKPVSKEKKNKIV